MPCYSNSPERLRTTNDKIRVTNDEKKPKDESFAGRCFGFSLSGLGIPSDLVIGHSSFNP